MGLLWGIDLGGTKIEGVILEEDSLKVLQRTRISTEAAYGYHHIMERITNLVEVMITGTGLKPDAIGIGTPGVLDPKSQTMKNANTTALNGRFLKKDLENLLKVPIKMANDANCFAIAETKMGAVAEQCPDAQVVFGIIMGTGVGSGVVVNGQVLDGKHGIAGEWGHNFLHKSGGNCYCGRSGCVETIISGPALERYYTSLTGFSKNLSTIMDSYHKGKEGPAILTARRLLQFFGKAVANVINILDPDVIVLGGGLGNIDLLYTEGIAEVEKYIFNDRLETPFLKPKLGDSAGVFGAALL